MDILPLIFMINRGYLNQINVIAGLYIYRILFKIKQNGDLSSVSSGKYIPYTFDFLNVSDSGTLSGNQIPKSSE